MTIEALRRELREFTNPITGTTYRLRSDGVSK
jgi:hypothetical protein